MRGSPFEMLDRVSEQQGRIEVRKLEKTGPSPGRIDSSYVPVAW